MTLKVPRVIMGPVTVVGPLGLMLFHPVVGSVVGLASILSKGKLCGRDRVEIVPEAVENVLRPLQPFRKTAMVLVTTILTLPVVSPATWRSICYWRRILPLVLQYLKTRKKAKRVKNSAKRSALWAAQHEAGAKQLVELLERFRGFMLKLAQILATKSDYLPEAYPRHLSKVYCSMPVSTLDQVSSVIRRELRTKLEDIFVYFEPEPIASATVAQVHKAYLASSGDAVAVKVQHKRAKAQICSDIKNLLTTVKLLSAIGADLGFDMVSLAKEYAEVVPYEFDFVAEVDNMVFMRNNKMDSITRLGLTHPYQSMVEYPNPQEDFCTSRVIVMDFIEGKPFVNRAQPAMPNQLAEELLTALLHDYGRQIFIDHAFHTDPHPGNLLLTPDDKLALLDMGQMKYLSKENVTTPITETTNCVNHASISSAETLAFPP
eukprot:1192520-Prorocentrum_minimum.AAC.3